MRRFQTALILSSIALASAPGSVALAQEPTGWMELGGSATNAGISGSAEDRSTGCDVAVDPAGNPIVAWLESPADGAPYIYLRKWNGAAWIELGGSATGTGVHGPIYGAGKPPQVEVDLAGNPIVSWVEMAFLTGEVMAKKFVGGAWVPLGSSTLEGGISLSGDTVKEHAMTVDAAGNPVIAWVTTPGFVHLRRWNGTTWIELGGSGTTGVPSPSSPMSPTVAVDSLDRPWIAWVGMVFILGDVYLVRWDPASSSWIAEGGSLTGFGISGTSRAFFASMMIDRNDRPTVAWMDIGPPGIKIYAKTLIAGAWTELGGSATELGLGPALGAPSAARSPAGDPVIAFPHRDSEGIADTYLKTWTGSAWVGISGSDAGGGISATAEVSGACSLSIGSTGRLAVAWEEGAAESLDIRLKAHDHPALTSLAQYESDGVTPIDLGGMTEDTTLVFKGRLQSLATGVQVRLEVQVEPVGVDFSGTTATTSSALVNSGALATVTLPNLGIGSYHWRARVTDPEEHSTPWSSFGGNTEESTDFRIGTLAPAPGGGGGGGGSSGGCGGSAAPIAGAAVAFALAGLAASVRHPARR